MGKATSLCYGLSLTGAHSAVYTEGGSMEKWASQFEYFRSN